MTTYTTDLPQRDQCSVGHLCFHGDYEFFDVAGEVYKAHRSTPFTDHMGQTRSGRWECSRTLFEHFRGTLLSPIK